MSEAEKKERRRISNKKYYDNNIEKLKKDRDDNKEKTALNSERCEKCNEKYTKKNVKCMDHIHKDGKYGKFRNILCNACNSKTDRKIQINNKSGISNISWCNTHKRWAYYKEINGKIHRKYFFNKSLAISYKKDYEEQYNLNL